MAIAPLHLAAYFGAGLFAANTVPHFVAGVCGRPFQSPFASPSGVGLSSSVTNVAWGSINAVVAFLLLTKVGTFSILNDYHAAAFGVGAFGMASMLGSYFGKFHGGDLKAEKKNH